MDIDVVLVMGRRYAGKDYCIDAWIAQGGGAHVSPTAHAKAAYARVAGVPLDDLHTRAKETHRAGLTAWVMAELARDPHVFDRAALEEARRLGGRVFIDVRLRSQYDFFVERGARSVHVHVPDAVRRARGWIPSEIDAHPTECELDGVGDMHYENVDPHVSPLHDISVGSTENCTRAAGLY